MLLLTNLSETKPKRGRKRWTWKRPFLDALRVNGNITQSATAVGVSKQSVQERMKRYPVFSKQVDAALAESDDRLYQEAQRRARDGVDEPLVYQGQITGWYVRDDGTLADGPGPGVHFWPNTIKRYSDRLLMFLLSYRGFDRTQHGSATTVNVQVNNVVSVPPEDFRRLSTADKVRMLRGQGMPDTAPPK